MEKNITEREKLIDYLICVFNFTREQAIHLLSISNDRITN